VERFTKILHEPGKFAGEEDYAMATSLELAIAAIRSGRKEEGRQLLNLLIQQNPNNEMAWLWMSSVVDSDDKRVRSLSHVLAINPHNSLAQRGLRYLGAELPPPAAPPVPKAVPPEPPLKKPPPTPQAITQELPFTPIRNPFAKAQPTPGSGKKKKKKKKSDISTRLRAISPANPTLPMPPQSAVVEAPANPTLPMPPQSAVVEALANPTLPIPPQSAIVEAPANPTLPMPPQSAIVEAPANPTLPMPPQSAVIEAPANPTMPMPVPVEEATALPPAQAQLEEVADSSHPVSEKVVDPSKPLPVTRPDMTRRTTPPSNGNFYHPQPQPSYPPPRPDTRPSAPLFYANGMPQQYRQGPAYFPHSHTTMGMPIQYPASQYPTRPMSTLHANGMLAAQSIPNGHAAYPAYHSAPTMGYLPSQFQAPMVPVQMVISPEIQAPNDPLEALLASNDDLNLEILHRVSHVPDNVRSKKKQTILEQEKEGEHEPEEVNLLAVILFGSLSVTALGGLGMLILLAFTTAN
jgi:hypothetical protein